MNVHSQKAVPSLHTYFDPEDPSIKQEILTMIIQYLDETGYQSSSAILKDEARMKSSADSSRRKDLNSIKESVLASDWSIAESVQLEKLNNPRLVYLFYRYHFVDLLTKGDHNEALTFLSSRLRPYRAFEEPTGDFDYLCMLLVDSASPNRTMPLPDNSALKEKTLTATDEELSKLSSQTLDHPIPKGRLFTLIQQAAALQLGKYPLGAVKSIVNDFVPAILPQTKSVSLPTAHTGQVKAVKCIPGTDTLLSAGSDSVVRVWDIPTRALVSELKGHTGCVWTAAGNTDVIITGGADETVRVWSTKTHQQVNMCHFTGGDIYSVDIEPMGRRFICGGFGKEFIMADIETGKTVMKRNEHFAAITSVLFDATGNLAVTGSKDLTIKIWDLRNSIVIRTLSPVLSEVTSVDADKSFTKILGSTKNSTARIWDMRMAESMLLLKGHQNSSKHFVRSRFGPDDRTVVGGSDDGKIFVWGSTSGSVLEKINAHQGPAFDVSWCESQRLYASCGGESVIKLWNVK